MISFHAVIINAEEETISMMLVLILRLVRMMQLMSNLCALWIAIVVFFSLDIWQFFWNETFTASEKNITLWDADFAMLLICDCQENASGNMKTNIFRRIVDLNSIMSKIERMTEKVVYYVQRVYIGDVLRIKIIITSGLP